MQLSGIYGCSTRAGSNLFYVVDLVIKILNQDKKTHTLYSIDHEVLKG
ncbi:hypothetical protein MEG1DRAFT_01479 [Photorhabdus temperata subsp. temperata Meg1]|uniref:Uncharacterized protein n=1 Tax=Photorhabdus temperata subsp. temperata Meg1 TaxID=1393735 RepID=A0A081RYN5_PHOTE|nr:hypothetical protein MEG1DRAFT_01479 [Photorhabdus temperata subsp. temperata Meg1]